MTQICVCLWWHTFQPQTTWLYILDTLNTEYGFKMPSKISKCFCGHSLLCPFVYVNLNVIHVI